MFLIIILPPFFIFFIVVSVIILLLRSSRVIANAQASGLTRDAKREANASVHAKYKLADELLKGAGGLLTREQAEAQAGFTPVISSGPGSQRPNIDILYHRAGRVVEASRVPHVNLQIVEQDMRETPIAGETRLWWRSPIHLGSAFPLRSEQHG
jgi:hypothetical protein